MRSVTQNYTGKVKWFNNKSGYGFITVINESDLKEKDIFAHHTSIEVHGNLYKYLVQGEYVIFDVQKMEDRNHENHAISIRGILNHDLMCETRFKNKEKENIRPRQDRRPPRDNKKNE